MEKPNSPEKIVSATASEIICLLMIFGVAPIALRIPISLVRSLTVINKILLIAMTPANNVKIPIKNENPCKTIIKALIPTKICDRSKEPIALESSGCILYLVLSRFLIFVRTGATE